MIEGLDNVRHEAFNDDEITNKFRSINAVFWSRQDKTNLTGITDTQARRRSYLIDTPKHLIAIAASKKTAALGNVICATAKKEARLCGVRVAHSDRRYRPKLATQPENTQVMIPGIMPTEAIAFTGH